MRCDECLPLLEEYLDGEVNAKGKREITLHLDGCASCSAALQELNAEQNLYGNYKPDLEVNQALWNGVRARISKPSFGHPAILPGLWRRLDTILKPTVSTWAAVGMVLAAVGLTIVVMKYGGTKRDANSAISSLATEPKDRLSQQQPLDERKVYETPAALDPASVNHREINRMKVNSAPRDTKLSPNAPRINRTKTPDRLVREAEQKYLAAIAMLSRNVDRRRGRLDSETLARFQQTLSSIDRTIADTRRAVQRDPVDPVAVQYMLTAYSKKVDALRAMADY